MDDYRLPVAALALSLSGFLAYVGYEGYSATARPPVQGDAPTYGFGSTKDAAGEALKGGEKITPREALRLAARDIEQHADGMKACLPGVALAPHEFDAFLSLTLNVGVGNFCKSSIPGKLKAGHYAAACKTILDFKRYQGKDCSKAEYKSLCGGIWKRRQEEYKTCVLADGDAPRPRAADFAAKEKIPAPPVGQE